MRTIITFLVFVATLTGCVEEYDLKLTEAPIRLVVEGLITNEPGPYYVRLTESHSGKLNVYLDNAKAVKDALIIITDNVNQIDTLIPANVDDYRLGDYKLVYDNFGNIFDTVWLSADPYFFDYDRGFYKTTTLVGIPGRTYSLKIIHQNKEYRASSYMPPVTDIDSLGLIKTITPEGKPDTYSPLLYFSEPQETKDYYLVQYVDEIYARTTYSWAFYWPFSILSDEFLEPYVDGLHIGSGANILDYKGLPFSFGWGAIYVRLNSLTREAYLYYRSLIQQFENDGGAFQPAPASAPTNINNGALGFFRASAVSEKSIVFDQLRQTQLELLTLEVTEITTTTAVSGGEQNDFFSGVISRGICWSPNPNPTIDDFTIRDITWKWERFSCTMTNLTPDTKYYVRVYVTDRYGMVHYGNQVEFTTLTE